MFEKIEIYNQYLYAVVLQNDQRTPLLLWWCSTDYNWFIF